MISPPSSNKPQSEGTINTRWNFNKEKSQHKEAPFVGLLLCRVSIASYQPQPIRSWRAKNWFMTRDVSGTLRNYTIPYTQVISLLKAEQAFKHDKWVSRFECLLQKLCQQNCPSVIIVMIFVEFYL